jgi:hypothetical protein
LRDVGERLGKVQRFKVQRFRGSRFKGSAVVCVRLKVKGQRLKVKG